MQKIILSALFIIGSAGIIAIGGTGAFFSDTETSTGNTLAAGSIDLKIDNESYYNGIATSSLSWELDDLSNGHLFFNFFDLKPDDEGEDTISLHVENDAWACMEIALTSNNDRSSNEPELGTGDLQEDPNNDWDGELAQNLQMFWWADDGDNVYEVGEESISGGIQTLFDLATTTPFKVSLADADENIWDEIGPMPANSVQYIGKAWCFGTLTLDPVAAGQGVDPTVDPGVNCDGTGLGNETQTDGATLDIEFTAVQARHNPNYQCEPTANITTLTLEKTVIKNNAGTASDTDWTLSANGPTPISGTEGSAAVTAAVVTPGSYDLSEAGGPAGYTPSAWVCVGGTQNDGDTVTIGAGDSVTCTITNDDIGTSLTLVKEVSGIEGGPDEIPSAWTLFAATGPTPFSGPGPSVSSAPSFLPGTYDLSETGPAGYTPSAWVCVGGTQNDADTVTLLPGESATCTIVNSEDEIIACNAELDLMLVLDRSGSINSTEMGTLKTAAHAFISSLAPSTPGVHTGQTSFSTTGTTDLALGDDEAAAHLAINDLPSPGAGSTDLEASITLANTQLVGGRPVDAIVVITDGAPNIPSEAQGALDAAAAADAARAAGTEVYVVGVGVTAGTETYLKTEIADDAAHYFAAADFDDLQAILQGLVACDQNRVAYTYVGVTEANDGTGVLPIAFEHDSDVWPWTSFSDENSSTTPSSTEYTDISSDNNNDWDSADPGTGDVMVKQFRFKLAETVANIDDIKVLWKGQPNAAANATVWVLKTGTSPYSAANWVQLGALLAIPADTDRYVVRHIDGADAGLYVSGVDGRIDFMVAIDNDSELLRTDYIELLVASTP